MLATGQKANDELYFALKGTVANLHRIGDCLAPRKLDHAIYEGELAGRELWSPEERYIYEGELERWEEATVGAPRSARRAALKAERGTTTAAAPRPQAIFSHDCGSA